MTTATKKTDSTLNEKTQEIKVLTLSIQRQINFFHSLKNEDGELLEKKLIKSIKIKKAIITGAVIFQMEDLINFNRTIQSEVSKQKRELIADSKTIGKIFSEHSGAQKLSERELNKSISYEFGNSFVFMNDERIKTADEFLKFIETKDITKSFVKMYY